MPNKYGTQRQLAKEMGVTESTVCKWKRTGKLDGLIRKDGKVDITKALEVLPGRVAPKQQQSQNIRWGKEQKAPPEDKSPETEAEIKSYLDESIGDLSRLNIAELQRRNELEKLLIQQIKRKQQSGELVLSEDIERKAFEAGKAFKESCLAIADRCAPLVAAESSDFECKQILVREINYILEGLSERLEVI